MKANVLNLYMENKKIPSKIIEGKFPELYILSLFVE